MGRNLEIVRGFHEKFSEVDFDIVRDAMARADTLKEPPPAMQELWKFSIAHVDPRIEIENRSSSFSLPDLPRGTKLHGWPGWRHFWAGWLDPWMQFKSRAGNFVEVGDDVILDMEITAVGRVSGVPTDLRLPQVWTVKQSRVVRIQLFDTRSDAEGAAGGSG
jgi:hypothetical protein